MAFRGNSTIIPVAGAGTKTATIPVGLYWRNAQGQHRIGAEGWMEGPRGLTDKQLSELKKIIEERRDEIAQSLGRTLRKLK